MAGHCHLIMALALLLHVGRVLSGGIVPDIIGVDTNHTITPATVAVAHGAGPGAGQAAGAAEGAVALAGESLGAAQGAGVESGEADTQPPYLHQPVLGDAAAEEFRIALFNCEHLAMLLPPLAVGEAYGPVTEQAVGAAGAGVGSGNAEGAAQATTAATAAGPAVSEIDFSCHTSTTDFSFHPEEDHRQIEAGQSSLSSTSTARPRSLNQPVLGDLSPE